MKKRINLQHVEQIIFALTREHLTFNEPIPDFGTRFPNILESCLAAPFLTFGGKELYPDPGTKAGILFYLMIKNHPFKNGNKRIAMTTLFYVLAREGAWLRADIKELYNFAVWVAESPPDAKDEVVLYIKKFLEKHLVPFT